ncbi:hypothetical protein SB761_36565, partial [Pseudomonas sp. SIMBA_064]
DEPEKYDGQKALLAPGVTIHHRDQLDDVQRELREIGREIVLDARHGFAERRGERRELRGLFAGFGLAGLETLLAALV